MTDTAAAQPRRLRLILALVAVAIALVAALLYLNRKSLAREALTGWLRGKGVASQAEVEAFGPGVFTARLRLGDPRHPDFAAERARVGYRLTFRGVEVTSVRLTKPVLRAAIRDRKLSVGSLDPLVEEFRRRPPRPDAAKPRIEIDDGVLLLATDYGPVRLTADALVDDARLMSLTAVSAPARLRGRGFDVALGPGKLRVVTRGPRVEAELQAPVARAAVGEATARESQLRLMLEGPYPDLVKRRGEGALVVQARLAGRDLTLADRRFGRAELSAAFIGETRGWIPDLVVAGRATAGLRADGGDLAGARLGQVSAGLVGQDLRWTRRGGDRVTADLRLQATVTDLAAGDLRAPTLTLAAAGPVAHDRQGLEATLTGSAVGRGAWTALGPPTAADSGDVAALKRAARSFRIAAPAVTLRAKGAYLAVALPQPARLAGEAGGVVQIAARGGGAVWSPTGSGFRLTMGDGLPAVEADVTSLSIAEGAATAAGRVRARLSAGPVIAGDVDATGRLRIADGGLAFTADRCAAIKAERLEFGANDVERLSARLCPIRSPLLAFAGGDWRIVGRAEAGSASVPFLQASLADARGRIDFGTRRQRLDAQVAVEAARVLDAAPEGRFSPLAMRGQARLSGDVWRADLDFSLPGGPRVAGARLVHDALTGGGVEIETGELVFAEGGLQPVQLSPMAAPVGSPATGQARFSGRFDWNLQGATSSGALSIPRLDFESPAGRVEGLSGELAFTSLAPLTAAPGQQLRVARIEAIVPLTDVTATFSLADNRLRIAGGEAAVGGGKVRVEQLDVPFDPAAPTKGILIFEGVQLHDLVEASPFGDKVEFDAKVSGRVPFEAVKNRVRITGGELRAIQPGRISISREAITGVEAAGEITGPAGVEAEVDPNATFTDFAYQAMENLAFDKLEATLASREDGRMGVLFHIIGRHDPPQKQRIRLTIMDLIQRRFLGRKLPLPSGTGVNLTLDTTLNLDDLLADYAEYQRLSGSGPVQP